MKIALAIAVALAMFSACEAGALQDRQRFSKRDFKYDINDSSVSRAPEGVEIRPVLGAQFPPLQGLGIGIALFRFPPCAINPLHVHPRSTELITVTSGDHLKVGFVEENGGRVIINRLKEGQFTVFPQGLVHFQFNDSCEEATFVSARSSDDPGVQSFPSRLLEFPDDVLTAAFGLRRKGMEELKSAFGARGRQAQCLKRCGLSA